MNTDIIIHVEKLNVENINETKLKLQILFVVNSMYHKFTGEIEKRKEVFKYNDEETEYLATKFNIPVEKREPLTINVVYLKIQNNPCLRIVYKESDKIERTITYELTKENQNGDYKLNMFENSHKEI